MVWVKLDEHFPDHRKLAELGDYAPLCGWLFICGLAYCNRQLTDGKIPKAHVPRLSSFRHIGIETGRIDSLAAVGEDIETEDLAKLLVSVGFWEEDEDYYYVHDYHDYQPSKAQVEAERKAKAEAGRLGGLARAQAGAKQVLEQNVSSIQARSLARAQADALAKSKPVTVTETVTETDPETAAEADRGREAAAAAAEDDPFTDGMYREVCDFWAQATGMLLSPAPAERMVAAAERTSLTWMKDAITEMAGQNVRNPKYALAIVDRWEREGRAAAEPEGDDFAARKRRYLEERLG